MTEPILEGGATAEIKSTLVSRNITVLGRRTSVRLEPEMWTSLREIAKRESCKIHDICSLIQLRKNPNTSLTAAIRVFLMLYYRAASTEEGHNRAGHGNFSQMMHRARMNTVTLDNLKTLGRKAKNAKNKALNDKQPEEEKEQRQGLPAPMAAIPAHGEHHAVAL